jgi:iron complex transport system substrate-binding protein
MTFDARIPFHFESVTSRRRFLAGLGGATFAAAFLAACGGDDAAPRATASATPSSTGAAAATTAVPTETAASVFPVTLSHKYGSTVIATEPQRVLSLGYNDQDAILAVGVTPIATRYWFGEEPGAVFPWAQGHLQGATPEVLNMPWDALDFEKIASLQPDVIIAVYSGVTEEEYATLSQIAPVVAQSGEYIDYGMPWDEGARLTAAALGRANEMEEVIAGVEAQFEAARAAHPEFQGLELVLAAMRADGQVGLFAAQDGRTRVFTRLGFSVPPELDGLFGDSFYANISAEQFDLLDTADVVAWTQVVYAGREAILENPVYSQLSVAKEGRHFLLDDQTDAAFSFNSVLSLPYALEVVVSMAVAALDGDPETNAEAPAA